MKLLSDSICGNQRTERFTVRFGSSSLYSIVHSNSVPLIYFNIVQNGDKKKKNDDDSSWWIKHFPH